MTKSAMTLPPLFKTTPNDAHYKYRAGGLYDCVHDIVHLSSEQNVPIFYGLNKTKISKILARPKSTITSAVSVFSYHGAEVSFTSSKCSGMY